jgi:hypothetical protein
MEILFSRKKDDVIEIERDDIILKLTQPSVSGRTIHTQASKCFGIDFISFNKKIMKS